MISLALPTEDSATRTGKAGLEGAADLAMDPTVPAIEPYLRAEVQMPGHATGGLPERDRKPHRRAAGGCHGTARWHDHLRIGAPGATP